MQLHATSLLTIALLLVVSKQICWARHWCAWSEGWCSVTCRTYNSSGTILRRRTCNCYIDSGNLLSKINEKFKEAFNPECLEHKVEMHYAACTDPTMPECPKRNRVLEFVDMFFPLLLFVGFFSAIIGFFVILSCIVRGQCRCPCCSTCHRPTCQELGDQVNLWCYSRMTRLVNGNRGDGNSLLNYQGPHSYAAPSYAAAIPSAPNEGTHDLFATAPGEADLPQDDAQAPPAYQTLVNAEVPPPSYTDAIARLRLQRDEQQMAQFASANTVQS